MALHDRSLYVGCESGGWLDRELRALSSEENVLGLSRRAAAASESMPAITTTEFSYELYETVTRAHDTSRSRRSCPSSGRRVRAIQKLFLATNDGVFKSGIATFPHEVRALVVKKIAYDTYTMSNTGTLHALSGKLQAPGGEYLVNFDASGTNMNGTCVVRSAGNPKMSTLPYHSGILRGIVEDFAAEDNMCRVLLVDYGQMVLCSASSVLADVFYFQPSEVRELPSAVFNCRIIEVTPPRSSGRKTVELTVGMTYDVCLKRKLNNKLFAGTAVVPLVWQCSLDDVQVDEQRKRGVAVNTEVDYTVPDQLRDEEERIAERKRKVSEEEEALHRERIAFERECMEREKGVALMAMQMQLLDVSNRLNAIFAASLPNVSWGAPFIWPHLLGSFASGTGAYTSEMLASLGIEWPQLSRALQVASSSQDSIHNNGERAVLGRNVNEVDMGQTNITAHHTVAPSQPQRSSHSLCLLDSELDAPSGSPDRRCTSNMGNSLSANSSQNAFLDESTKSECHRHTSPPQPYYKCQSDGYFSNNCPKYANSDDMSPTTDTTKHLAVDSTPSSSSSTGPTTVDSFPNSLSTLPSSSPSTALLKYSPHFPCIRVKEGDALMVRRCDGDEANKNWPLFFVKVLKDKATAAAAAEVEFLTPTILCKPEHLHAGFLCIAYSHTFRRYLRAVIAKITGATAEVHFVDRGNDEIVESSQLWSIDDQAEIVAHQCGLALPCVLQEFDDFGSGDFERFDEDTLQEAVSCQQRSFKLRIVKQRADGLAFVELL
ncbi:hypothetical protein Tcan_03926 [Toxocara canis]|uniref:Tudor domain-containing protein n=1 Tax=Toxocara canis TaxID=6265 RepID=A0A0B2VUA3_TOXCA|nr:hypothetical protein Tcan_03926 [Toxocara canis]